MSEDYYDLSPYSYCAGNPIKNKDINGEWIWAAVGVVLDYGLQVYDNYQNGSTGYNAWVGDVNFVSVGLSAVNPTGKFIIAKTLIVEGTKAAIEFKPNTGNDRLQDEKKKQ